MITIQKSVNTSHLNHLSTIWGLNWMLASSAWWWGCSKGSKGLTEQKLHECSSHFESEKLNFLAQKYSHDPDLPWVPPLLPSTIVGHDLFLLRTSDPAGFIWPCRIFPTTSQNVSFQVRVTGTSVDHLVSVPPTYITFNTYILPASTTRCQKLCPW